MTAIEGTTLRNEDNPLGAACKHSLWSDAWNNARTGSSTKDVIEAD